MDISVIIPIYNVEKHVEKCVRSLFNQTKTDKVEYIFVNDSTPDNSISIIKNIAKEYSHVVIRVIEHEKNRGLAAARQTGIDNAKGKYSIHIDSDDWCELTMLEDLFKVASENDADVVVCDFYWTENDKDIYIQQELGNNNIESIRSFIKGTPYSSTIWNKLVKTSIYRTNNLGWIEGLNYCEDFYICCQIFSVSSKIEYLNRAFLHYVQHKDSMMKVYDSNSIINKANTLIATEVYLNKVHQDEFKKDLIEGKAKFKFLHMKNMTKLERRKLAHLFPETRSCIFQLSLGIHHKIALLASYYRIHFVYNLIWDSGEFVFKLKKLFHQRIKYFR